ncbi:MAG: hypothetical protein ACM3JG_05455 [Thiohalocapsa sp.]
MRVDMVLGRPSRAEWYRRRAATIRSTARRMRSIESRLNMAALADSFDKLAQRLEEREQRSAAAD